MERRETGVLRIVTAGSVNDGKSTLIGRLLFDSHAIPEDQLEAVARASRDRGADRLNLALLTDGLRAERAQGITIDVAYRYFSTSQRKFILADAPGHAEYTRNFVTAASTADRVVLLVDATRGIVEQTRRHLLIAAWLRIPGVVVCVNKMDLVGYARETFAAIDRALVSHAEALGIELQCIPISAFLGDQIVTRSRRMPWHVGPTLLEYLESVDLTRFEADNAPLRASVQLPISAPAENYRGYAVALASGRLRLGEEICIYPTGVKTRVGEISVSGTLVSQVASPYVALVRLTDEVDLARGNLLADPESPPTVGQEIELELVWMADAPLEPAREYTVMHLHREVHCRIAQIHYLIDVATMKPARVAPPGAPASRIERNTLARVTLITHEPLFYDPYRRSRATGSLILRDESTGETCAAGMIWR